MEDGKVSRIATVLIHRIGLSANEANISNLPPPSSVTFARFRSGARIVVRNNKLYKGSRGKSVRFPPFAAV